jgi:hypothetical protein
MTNKKEQIKLSESDKIKIDNYYNVYKQRVINTHQENLLHEYKHKINKLSEIEIIIARLDKFPTNDEAGYIREKYDNYINLAREVYLYINS